ncbi:MAG: hypothetical protein LUG18_03950 [Candidatus Azobacteroides sp.]|nr:hypothetical protein [Candidatus Azobacteroides sp.]
MINNLMELVQQFTGNTVNNNPDIPQEKKGTVVQSAAEGIFNGLRNQASGGDLGQILNLFGSRGNNVSNSLSQNIQSSVISSLMSKAGINNQLAQNLAGQIVPNVLGLMSKKAADPNNSQYNVNGILSSITGGKTNGIDIQGLLNKYTGGEDGKFDMNDIMHLISGNNKEQGNSDGGILSSLGGLLGNK